MTLTSNAVVECALERPTVEFRDRIVLTADELAAAWGVARHLNPQWVRSYGDDLAYAKQVRPAAVYALAASIQVRAASVALRPVQGPSVFPDCGRCGEEVAAWRVFCDAEDGGELLACDACADGGNHLDSPAIAWMERVAIGRNNKVRVDSFNVADVPWAVAC